MNLMEFAKKYFDRFSHQDIDALEKMFHDDVVLRDWENEFKGKAAVVKANKDIFAGVKVIIAKPLKVLASDTSFMAEIEVIINNGDTVLKVVDVIDIKDEKIIAIRAYKG